MNRGFNHLDQFNDLIGRGGIMELSDIPITGRFVAMKGLDWVPVVYDETPAVRQSGHQAIIAAPGAFLIEELAVHMDDNSHPGIKAALHLNNVGRYFGPWPFHAFHRMVTGGQFSDEWFMYSLNVPIMLPPAGVFEIQISRLDATHEDRKGSVLLQGKLARPL
jgi:hypothetical protein